MENWNELAKFLVPKRIKALISKSPEISQTRSRKPHIVPSPFPLVFPHTHQNDEEAKRTPAIFLACAKDKEKILNVKPEEEGQEGDKIGRVLCFCENPEKKDRSRTALFQECKEGEDVILPDGAHLVSSRAIFFNEVADGVEEL